MGISGYIGGGAVKGWQDMLEQQLAEELREDQRKQQEIENEMRRRQMLAQEQEREYQRGRDKRADQMVEAAHVLEALMSSHDPESGAPIEVAPEHLKALEGTPYMSRVKTRQIPEGLTSDDMEAAVIPASTRSELVKTTQQREAERVAGERRQQLARVDAAKNNPNLNPELRRMIEVLGPDALKNLDTSDFISVKEAYDRKMNELKGQSAIAVNQFWQTRPPEAQDVKVIHPVTGQTRILRPEDADELMLNEGYVPYEKEIHAPGAKGRGAEGEQAKSAALNVLQELKTQQDKFNVIPGWVGNIPTGAASLVAGPLMKKLADAGIWEDVALYESAVEGFVPLLARAVGHVGVLTQQDVDSVKRLVAYIGEPNEQADKKFSRFVRIITNGNPELIARAGRIDPNKKGIAAWIPADPNDKTTLAERLAFALQEDEAKAGGAAGGKKAPDHPGAMTYQEFLQQQNTPAAAPATPAVTPQAPAAAPLVPTKPAPPPAVPGGMTYQEWQRMLRQQPQR